MACAADIPCEKERERRRVGEGREKRARVETGSELQRVKIRNHFVRMVNSFYAWCILHMRLEERRTAIDEGCVNRLA